MEKLDHKALRYTAKALVVIAALEFFLLGAIGIRLISFGDAKPVLINQPIQQSRWEL